MLLNREEFVNWIKREASLVEPIPSIWATEKDLDGEKCQWFVVTPHIPPTVYPYRPVSSDETDYWLWCTTTLRGRTRCFYSNFGDKEVWGFTVEEDIPLWLMKWR